MPPRGRDRRAVVIEPDTAKHGSIGGGREILSLQYLQPIPIKL